MPGVGAGTNRCSPLVGSANATAAKPAKNTAAVIEKTSVAPTAGASQAGQAQSQSDCGTNPPVEYCGGDRVGDPGGEATELAHVRAPLEQAAHSGLLADGPASLEREAASHENLEQLLGTIARDTDWDTDDFNRYGHLVIESGQRYARAQAEWARWAAARVGAS